MWSQFDGEHVAGAARRRRERRLRAYLKYAWMSVAMALAEARHHTAPRGQVTARAEATNDAPRSQTTSAARDTGTDFFAMSEDSDVVGRWPAAVSRGCAAAGAGSAAHRGADRRPCAFGFDASRRCAADGGTVGGLSRTSRFPCCRACHRGAQDRVSTQRCSHSSPCAADGRTVGGSADGVVLFFAPAAYC